jgi:hypothetical protein
MSRLLGNILAYQGVFPNDDANTMFTTAALITYLFQASSAVPPPPDVPPFDCLSYIEDNLAAMVSQPRPEQIEEQEFVFRFNKLVTALREFSRSYNSRGTIDVKQVRAVQKAIRQFEKSAWFRQTDNRHADR